MNSDWQIQGTRSWKKLGAWFQAEQRILPWREDPSPYRVWVSEIMLQQTQVATVLPYFQKFIERFPTVESLAQADQSDVLLHWAGLGYYSRARNLHLAAKQIVERGEFPSDRENWMALPGVGAYTAGAILSIAYNQVEALLDGNVERVLSRLRCIPRESTGRMSPYKVRLWSAAWRAVRMANSIAKVEPRILNQALMELGARICTPKKPACLVCPLRSQCKAFLRGEVLLFPSPKPKKKWVAVEEQRVLVWNSKTEKVAVVQAPEGAWRAGLWDLPESFVTADASPEFQGEVEIRTVVTQHKITRRVKVFRASEFAAVDQWAWVNPDAPEVALGSAFKKSWKAARSMLVANP